MTDSDNFQWQYGRTQINLNLNSMQHSTLQNSVRFGWRVDQKISIIQTMDKGGWKGIETRTLNCRPQMGLTTDWQIQNLQTQFFQTHQERSKSRMSPPQVQTEPRQKALSKTGGPAPTNHLERWNHPPETQFVSAHICDQKNDTHQKPSHKEMLHIGTPVGAAGNQPRIMAKSSSRIVIRLEIATVKSSPDTMINVEWGLKKPAQSENFVQTIIRSTRRHRKTYMTRTALSVIAFSLLTAHYLPASVLEVKETEAEHSFIGQSEHSFIQTIRALF